MLPILKLYLDICLLRANAEDIPASKFLMIGTLLVYFTFSIGVALIDYTVTQAITTVVIGFVMMIGFAQAGLWVRNFLGRSMQTITALAGTGLIFDGFSWPIIMWAASIPEDQVSIGSYVLLVLLFWNITIIGHILKNALSIPFWAGIGISVLYVFTYLRVVRVLFIASTN